MRTATLPEFLALNDQLAALAEADIPICLDVGRSHGSLTESLEKLNAAIARRMGQGASLDQALAEEPTVTPSYRTFVQLSLQHGDLPAALASASRTAEAIETTRQVMRLSLVYPLLVCALAYVGFVLFCVFFVPRLENMYEGMGIARGTGLRTLQWLRGAIPFWAPIPPILLVLVLVATRVRRPPGACRGGISLPGAASFVSEQQWADFAETSASLLEAGTPLEEAIELAAGAIGDSRLQRELQPAPGVPPSAPLPPFLRWALFHSEPAIQTSRALRMAADIYHASAQRRIKRLKVIAPLVACVAIGGTATLLYGLALFVPVVQMLKAIAS